MPYAAPGELQGFYGRPVRFVHAIDDTPALMTRLGGGAGFDLDSIVTMLPRVNGKVDALVGDVRLGAAAIRGAAAGEIAALHRAYGFRDDGEALRARASSSRRAHRTPRRCRRSSTRSRPTCSATA